MASLSNGTVSQTRAPGVPLICPKFVCYTVGVGTDPVSGVFTHAHTELSGGFQPTRKAGTGFRKLDSLFGHHFVGGGVESLAFMETAAIVTHANAHAL